MKWTKSNIPEFESDRVKVFPIWHSDRRKRFNNHEQVISIDGDIVNREIFCQKVLPRYCDWDEYCQPLRKEEREQWANWVSTLED